MVNIVFLENTEGFESNPYLTLRWDFLCSPKCSPQDPTAQRIVREELMIRAIEEARKLVVFKKNPEETYYIRLDSTKLISLQPYQIMGSFSFYAPKDS